MDFSSSSQEMKICLVCDIDSKINYHFGTTTCLACASFFRRTVSLGIQYVCNKENNCSTSHVVRSGCRSCRFKKCEVAGMKAGLVRGKRDSTKTPKYVRDSVEQGNATVVRDYTTLTVETFRGISSKRDELENSPNGEKEINTLLNVTSKQLLQFYIELNKKSFLPLSKIDFNSLPELERVNNQESLLICQNCPGTDLLDLVDMGILLQFFAFANLWLDGLWAEIHLSQLLDNAEFSQVETTAASVYNDNARLSFNIFISNFKENVGKSLECLNLDFVEYAALKSICIWKLGIIDFGTTLKIFAQEHYLEVTAALTDYYTSQKDMNDVESALRIANITLLLGTIFNSYQEMVKLRSCRMGNIENEDILSMDY